MEEPKRLYVVSSLHHPPKVDGIHIPTLDVVDVRTKVIAAIAKTTRFGSYFADGISPLIAQRLNLILDTYTDRRILNTASKAYTRYGGPGYYEALLLVVVFQAAKENGIFYRFRETESGEMEEQDRKLRREIIGPNKRKFRKRFDSDEEMEEFVELEGVRIRDVGFVRKIEGNGGEENILYVGSHHKLETLAHSSLEWYRLEVDYEDWITSGRRRHVVAVTGEIPRRFERNLVELLTKEPAKNSCTIDLGVNFV